MFRVISLVTVKNGVDPMPLVEAARKMVADEPLILSGQVERGLGLMADAGVPHASYSLILDFDDEEAFHGYIAGAPHTTFNDLAVPHVERLVVTQYRL